MHIILVLFLQDAKVPRDKFVDRLSAALAALGSAQGFLRVFITDDGKPAPAAAVDGGEGGGGGGGAAAAAGECVKRTLRKRPMALESDLLTSSWAAAAVAPTWFASPLARYMSTFNGHMLWFVASLLLQVTLAKP